MRWVINLGTVAGIQLKVHLTFFLLLVWAGSTQWMARRDPVELVVTLAFLLALFGCVILHEFGHALTARRFGIRTRDITLLPIGGIARLERMPEEPKQELLVAIAGPAVNVVIAILLGAWLLVSGQWQVLSAPSLLMESFPARLLIVNLFLVGFNLLPAFPMDGGRVLRALLASRLPYAKATRIAGALGQAMAVLFAIAGLFGNILLLLIAAFVWIGAAQEVQMAEARHENQKVEIRKLKVES